MVHRSMTSRGPRIRWSSHPRVTPRPVLIMNTHRPLTEAQRADLIEQWNEARRPEKRPMGITGPVVEQRPGFLASLLGNPRLGSSIFSQKPHKNRENERSSE